MDEDDDLYGEPSVPTSVPQPILHQQTLQSSNGVVANLEARAEDEDAEDEVQPEDHTAEEDADEEEQDESEDDDVEIIMEPQARSLDFRSQNPTVRPATNRTVSATQTPNKPAPQPSSLTTDYTPLQRGALTPKTTATPQPTTVTPGILAAGPSQDLSIPGFGDATDQKVEEGPDPSTLPPAAAPPSHPTIDPSVAGTLDGRSILDVDLGAMAEKPWRRAGSDISDWFNYGFDEISWEAYCYRRRDLGELGNVLKVNIMNFAGMGEDQVNALPPELRTMVMTGATAMMNGGGANPNMMGGMNPMMDMSGMGGMMGMGMNGDMNMGGPMMQEGQGGPVTGGTPEQGGQMGMQEGFGGAPGGGMMGMGMGNEYGIQEQNQMSQQMYPGMEGSGTPGPGAGRGVTPGQAPFRGRGMVPRARGATFQARGRGRGGYAGAESGPPTGPARPASPLPPGVPTGPRNQNKYKDRDNNAPAVDGLDYGGTNKDSGGRTPSGEPEDRSRKRRSSPGLDSDRGSKRR